MHERVIHCFTFLLLFVMGSTGHFENKILTLLAKPDNEVRPAVIAAVIFSDKFCKLGLQAVQYL